MRIKILFTLLIFTLTGTLAPRQALAQSVSGNPNVVLLILDNSGSMKDNDPDGLRFTAARLFLSLLDEGTAAGVILFSTTSQPLLSEIITIESMQERRQLIDTVQPAPADGYTDIKAAFQDAEKLLAEHKALHRADTRPVVILLTDGQPEVEVPEATYNRDTMALIESLNVPVLSIALTRSAESAFLNQVASKTGGSVIPTENAADLLNTYLQVFSQIKDRTVVDLGGSQAPGRTMFELDPALAPVVEQASFVVTWQSNEAVAVRLVSPDGQEIQASTPGTLFQVFDDPQFAIMTLRQPAAGAWQIVIEGKGDFEAHVILSTRLRIRFDLPGSMVEAGQALPLRLMLLEEARNGEVTPIIGAANFSAVVTRPDESQERLDRFYDDGSHGDQQAGDGEYTRLYVNTGLEGMYQFQVQGWKGLTPVSMAGEIKAVRFPEMVLDEPHQPLYTIRSDPVLLSVHLDGAQENKLEQGTVIAHIMAPSGKKIEIALESSTQGYQAAFLPDESGAYQVDFETQQAAFLGLPYWRRLTANFQTKLIPALTLQSETLDLGRVELGQFSKGIPFSLRASSTSTQIETIQVRLEGLLNLTLGGPGSLQIFPGIGNEHSLVLLPQAELTPGVYTGSLVFAARQDLDLNHRRLPIQLEIYQSALKVGAPVNQPIDQVCPGWNSTVQIPIQADLAGQQTIRLRLQSPDQGLVQALVLNPDVALIQPGPNQLSVSIQGQGSLPSGKHTAHLVLEGRPGLQIEPAAGVRLTLDIPPVWVRCKKPIGLGLGIWFAVALGGLFLGSRIRIHNKPPFITGTLRHWPIQDPRQVIEVDLTGLKKPEVLIGQSEIADVNFPDPALVPMHATIKIERENGLGQLILEPISPVQKGYRKLSEVFPLKHGDSFQIGQQQLQYLSDHPLD